MVILEENFKWHLEAFASELFIYNLDKNYHSRRKFQMALRGFCIWTLHLWYL